MEDKVNISIDNYLNNKGIKYSLLNYIYRYHSYYDLKIIGDAKSDIIFFINNEFQLRNDHYKSFKLVYEKLISKRIKCAFISAKRRFWFYGGGKFKNQFNKVFDQVQNFSKILPKKVVVFCDSVPLQTYLIDIYNKLNVETFSFQHGFYAEDKNDVFRKVYKSSNSKNFFIWDNRTYKYMKKYNSSRNYIKVGPHYQPTNNSIKKIKKNKQIAIYSCGKDQLEENDYLAKIYFYIKKKSLDCSIIAHPKINLLDKINFYLKHGIWMSNNSKKSFSYLNSLILNSTVYLELENRGESYFILNNYFLKKCMPDFNDIINKNNGGNNGILRPFYDPVKSLHKILNTLINDL